MSDYKSHVWNQVALQLSFTGPGVELERKWRHMRDRYVRLRKLDRTSAPLKKGDKWLGFLYAIFFDRDRDPLKEFYASFSNNAGMPPLEPEPTCDSLSVSGGSGASKKRKADEPVEDDVGDTEVSLFVRSIEKTLSSMDARTFALARTYFLHLTLLSFILLFSSFLILPYFIIKLITSIILNFQVRGIYHCDCFMDQSVHAPNYLLGQFDVRCLVIFLCKFQQLFCSCKPFPTKFLNILISLNTKRTYISRLWLTSFGTMDYFPEKTSRQELEDQGANDVILRTPILRQPWEHQHDDVELTKKLGRRGHKDLYQKIIAFYLFRVQVYVLILLLQMILLHIPTYTFNLINHLKYWHAYVQVKEGYRMELPVFVPHEVQNIIKVRCWSENPNDRYAMSDICKHLQRALRIQRPDFNAVWFLLKNVYIYIYIYIYICIYNY
uniref:MADF domain-containing protein n=1 Tax=Heterorhabditis bacteriophora TaxID=37862 RepID=A0A1I7XFF8_HETBA